WLWLKRRHCENLVNKRLIESYAQNFARYIQCEDAISTYGLLGKHPTTGGVVSSPFVQMASQFQKAANLIWMEIYDIVKQNCTEEFEDGNPNDTMEQLLRSRKGR
ncbi:MAG: terminase, partial [Lachnospiraceae bacterium]|nr:terminase [Lachnospiraceae bacterium]